MRRQQVVGLVLMLSGAALLAVFQLGISIAIAPALVGAALLVAYAATRAFVYLVLGGVLTGLGIGLMADSATDGSGAAPLGLGAGLVFVAVLDRLSGAPKRGRSLLLLPAGLLLLSGLAQFAALRGPLSALLPFWPALLIGAGVWILVRRKQARARARSMPSDRTPI